MRKFSIVLLSLAFFFSACTPAEPSGQPNPESRPPSEPAVEVAVDEPVVEDSPAEESEFVHGDPTVSLTELVFEPFQLDCTLPPSNPFEYGEEGIHFVKSYDGDIDTAFWQVFFEQDDSQDRSVYPADLLEEVEISFFADGKKVAELSPHMEILVWECPDNGIMAHNRYITEGDSVAINPPGYVDGEMSVYWGDTLLTVSFHDAYGVNYQWSFGDYTQEGYWAVSKYTDGEFVETLTIYNGVPYTQEAFHPDLLRAYQLFEFRWDEDGAVLIATESSD